mgnify:CR=1 FL=1
MSVSRATRPRPFTVSRRTVLAGGAVSALAVLVACSSNSASQETSPAASGGASTGSGSAKSLPKSTVVPTELDSGLGSGQADGVFPRTVVHYQGETTINAAPTKVVIISTGQADAMLSLGMCPIGSTTASGAEGPVPEGRLPRPGLRHRGHHEGRVPKRTGHRGHRGTQTRPDPDQHRGQGRCRYPAQEPDRHRPHRCDARHRTVLEDRLPTAGRRPR